MTPVEAFNLLAQATATIQANRATHEKIQEALSVIKNLISTPRDTSPAEPEETNHP